MSGNENQESTIANHLCKNGCGFYGSTQFDGMCSVCYKENLKKKQKQDEDQIQKPASANHSAAAAAAAAAAALSASSSAASLPVTSSSASLLLEQPSAAVPADEDAQVSEDPPTSPRGPLRDGASADPQRTDGLDNKSGAFAASTAVAEGEVSKPKSRSRCGLCKRKIGLTGFDCRCGGIYCSAHRYSDKHACTFDYQSHGQEQIRRANPQVVSSKVDKL